MTNKELISTLYRVLQPKGIDPVFSYAVSTVESSNRGFRDDIPLVRFEKHVFLRYIKKLSDQSLLERANNLTGSNYNTYQRALAIDEYSANMATSFGLYQIMGFNFKDAGYASIEDFVDAMYSSEIEHINAFASFVEANNLVKYINEHNIRKFSYYYNGSAYEKWGYHIKLENAYNKAKQLME